MVNMRNYRFVGYEKELRYGSEEDQSWIISCFFEDKDKEKYMFLLDASLNLEKWAYVSNDFISLNDNMYRVNSSFEISNQQAKRLFNKLRPVIEQELRKRLLRDVL